MNSFGQLTFECLTHCGRQYAYFFYARNHMNRFYTLSYRCTYINVCMHPRLLKNIQLLNTKMAAEILLDHLRLELGYK